MDIGSITSFQNSNAKVQLHVETQVLRQKLCELLTNKLKAVNKFIYKLVF